MNFAATICDLCAEDEGEVELATHRYDSLTRTGMQLCERHVCAVNAGIANMGDLAPPRPVRVPAFNQLQLPDKTK